MIFESLSSLIDAVSVVDQSKLRNLEPIGGLCTDSESKAYKSRSVYESESSKKINYKVGFTENIENQRHDPNILQKRNIQPIDHKTMPRIDGGTQFTRSTSLPPMSTIYRKTNFSELLPPPNKILSFPHRSSFVEKTGAKIANQDHESETLDNLAEEIFYESEISNSPTNIQSIEEQFIKQRVSRTNSLPSASNLIQASSLLGSMRQIPVVIPRRSSFQDRIDTTGIQNYKKMAYDNLDRNDFNSDSIENHQEKGSMQGNDSREVDLLSDKTNHYNIKNSGNSLTNRKIISEKKENSSDQMDTDHEVSSSSKSKIIHKLSYPRLINEDPLSEKTKAPRKRITIEQTNTLQTMFDGGIHFPTREARERLARQLSLSCRTIQVWFQNKRQAARNKMRLEDRPALSSAAAAGIVGGSGQKLAIRWMKPVVFSTTGSYGRHFSHKNDTGACSSTASNYPTNAIPKNLELNPVNRSNCINYQAQYNSINCRVNPSTKLALNSGNKIPQSYNRKSTTMSHSTVADKNKELKKSESEFFNSTSIVAELLEKKDDETSLTNEDMCNGRKIEAETKGPITIGRLLHDPSIKLDHLIASERDAIP